MRFSLNSLRARLKLVFALFSVGGCVVAAALLVAQYRLNAREGSAAIRLNEQIARVHQLRNIVTRINQGPVESGSERDIESFRKTLDLAIVNSRSSFTEGLLGKVRESFRELRDGVLARRPRERLAPLVEDIVAQLEGAIAFFEHVEQESSARHQYEQLTLLRWMLAALVGFIVLSTMIGLRVIATISRPLSSLAKFMDRLDLETDLPDSMPSFGLDVTEVSHVTKSFERLIARLRGYRALNVRRLLIEKRRADIVAASIEDGIFLIRGEEILYANPVAERLLGATGAPARLDHPGADLACARAIRESLHRSIPVDFSQVIQGRRHHFLIQAKEICFDLIEKVEHSVSVNISQVLDRFQADVIVVAQDVTLVRESQEAKSHFLGTLSHEVKTPVTSLTMATRLLQRIMDNGGTGTQAQHANDTVRSLVRTCAEDVDRLRALLDDLMSVTRFDVLTQKLELKQIDFAKFLRHTIQSFQIAAGERGVGLVTSVMGVSPELMVPIDPAKISWALSNLITNAIRHTPRGGQVKVFSEVQEGSLRVSVSDTGPGIEKARQARIFEKYNSFYDIRVARSGSAGAGLSIAREIIVAHGGRIWVTSDTGSGAEFCFTIPLKRSVPELMAPTVMDSKGETHGATAGG